MLRTDGITIVQKEPYRYGYIDDALLDPSLLKHFPPISAFHPLPDYDGSVKLHLQKRAEGIKQHVGEWRDFRDWILDGGFRDWVGNQFGVEGGNARLEFSALPAPMGNVGVHTDISRKVFSAIIYHSGIPGETQFGNSPEGPWTNVPWKIGRMGFFERSDASWHKVDPVGGKVGQYRNSITLQLMRKTWRQERADGVAIK